MDNIHNIHKLSNSKEYFKCNMCGNHGNSYSYNFQGCYAFEDLYDGNKMVICEKCAYREQFGSKKALPAKKRRLLDELDN